MIPQKPTNQKKKCNLIIKVYMARKIFRKVFSEKPQAIHS